jgi:predicted esterase
VSLEKARDAVEGLKSAGADVIYCEEEVGHKLSSGCFRAMDSYFATQTVPE